MAHYIPLPFSALPVLFGVLVVLSHDQRVCN